ncbi:ribbon-helix-helix domain-containing protein [Quadrisphaera oryzae]|uniref:ribbon-helix-helix domain-containing protein n=1 Tax=Quadrisphaera TaxID=317661 RepID=UPI00164429BA|nr:ribbon-helix-helix domain-containing protein [Quadrisphaera sp. RL12-1S]MBC3760586.1 antitoxin [Quadrisphaera sp. RL12-1S]
MRTTLTIDDDVLAVAKERARQTGKTTGEVISELARQALVGDLGRTGPQESVYGWTPLPRRGGVVTNELIDDLREEEGV